MKTLLYACLLAVPFFGNRSGEEKEKREIIRKYILTDRMRRVSEGFFEKQVVAARGEYPDLPDWVWEEVEDRVGEEETFLNHAVEEYARHFSLSELRQIKGALELPAMKRWLSQDDVSSRSFGEMAMRCGREISRKIRQYLQERTYIE